MTIYIIQAKVIVLGICEFEDRWNVSVGNVGDLTIDQLKEKALQALAQVTKDNPTENGDQHHAFYIAIEIWENETKTRLLSHFPDDDDECWIG